MEYESEIKGLILESGSVGIASDAERLERRKADEDLAVHIENHDGAWFAARWAEAPILKVKATFRGRRGINLSTSFQ